MRISTTYDRIIHRVSKSFTCSVCGRRGARSTTFGQTLNPFNKGPDGAPKTIDRICSELRTQADQWQPTMHEKCE